MRIEDQTQATGHQKSTKSKVRQESTISATSIKGNDFESGMQGKDPIDPIGLQTECQNLKCQVTELAQSKESLKSKCDEELRRLSSKHREENDNLQKENAALVAEVHRLRANVVGAEFQAWDLESLLKQFENHRERWAEFLFDDDAKNGSQLAFVIQGIFRHTHNIVTRHVEYVGKKMYDFKLSSTNSQFIRGTLQSNYSAFENYIRYNIHDSARRDADCYKLKKGFLQVCKDEREEAEKKYHNLFDEMIKISGMLVLCEPKLTMSQEYNRNDPKTFVERITSAEKEVVCFPGLDLTDPGGNIRRLKVWIATPPSAGK